MLVATDGIQEDLPDLSDLRYYEQNRHRSRGRYPPGFPTGPEGKSARANLRKKIQTYLWDVAQQRFYIRVDPLQGELPRATYVPVVESVREAQLLLQEQHYF